MHLQPDGTQYFDHGLASQAEQWTQYIAHLQTNRCVRRATVKRFRPLLAAISKVGTGSLMGIRKVCCTAHFPAKVPWLWHFASRCGSYILMSPLVLQSLRWFRDGLEMASQKHCDTGDVHDSFKHASHLHRTDVRSTLQCENHTSPQLGCNITQDVPHMVQLTCSYDFLSRGRVRGARGSVQHHLQRPGAVARARHHAGGLCRVRPHRRTEGGVSQ